MVYIFGVNFGSENNVHGALSSNSSLIFPQRQSMVTNNNNPNCWNTNIIGSRDDASSSLPNNHYGLEYLAEDFKKICLNEENVMRGSNLNIGVTMKSKKAIKCEEPSNFKTCGLKVQQHDEFLTPSMTFSCIFCHRKFSSKRALGAHRRVHKTERENHHQKNNKVVTMKGKEVVQSQMPIYIDLTMNDSICGPVEQKHDFFIPSTTFPFNSCNKQFSPSPALREHQKSHKREREIHDQENNNNYKKVVTMKEKEVVKFEQYQYQPSHSMQIPIIDLTNNDSTCGWKVQEHNIFTPSKTFSCKFCNRSFSSARGLGGHKKAHKRKATLANHPQEMENFSSIHGIKIEDISIKLEDNVGESSINVDYHHTVKEELIELDLSLKL